MKTIKNLVIHWLLLVVSGLSAFAQQTGGAEVKEKTWAIVIGISDYENIAGLNYADKDAQKFYDYLINKHSAAPLPSNQIRLLLNDGARSTDIYEALEWLKASVKENDRIIFYFSGHSDVEQSNPDQDAFLLAYNSPMAAYAANGTVSINHLRQYFRDYIHINKARDVIVITDACRSGNLAGGENGVKLTRAALAKNQDNHIINLLSAQAGEISYENSKLGNGSGVFSYFFIKGIRGSADRNNDGYISTDELADYLQKNVPDATGHVQNPEINGNPKEKLFVIDNKLNKSDPPDADMAFKPKMSIGDGVAGNVDADVLADYNKYLEFTKQGRILWGGKPNGKVNYDDSVNCARYYYDRLTKNPRAAALYPSLRTSFMASLQRKTMDQLDEYVKGSFSHSVPNLYEQIKEMAYLKQMVASSDVLYNYILVREYFIETLDYSNNPRKRFQLLKKALQYEDDAPYVLNELISFAGGYKMTDSAKYYFEKGIAVAPKWAYLYLNMGGVFHTMHDTAKALYYYQKAITLDTMLVEAYNDIGALYQGIDHKKALNYHKEALKKDILPSSYFKNSRLTSIYYNLGIDYQDLYDNESALKYYNKCLQLDSTYGAASVNIGTIYAEQGKYAEALEMYQKGMRFDTTESRGYFDIGNMYKLQKRYPEAIESYKKAISLDSTQAVFHINLALMYLFMHDVKDAIPPLQKIAQLQPANPANYYNLACGYSLLDEPEEALISLKTALEKGFDDYKHIMSDTDLVNLRKTRKFRKLMKQYFAEQVK